MFLARVSCQASISFVSGPAPMRRGLKRELHRRGADALAIPHQGVRTCPDAEGIETEGVGGGAGVRLDQVSGPAPMRRGLKQTHILHAATIEAESNI